MRLVARLSHPNASRTVALQPLRLIAAGAAWLLASAAPAQAQMFKDAALQAVYAADQAAELARTGQQRLASKPDDAQAVLAVAMAALMAEDPARREAAITQAEACVARQPQAAECHYALGTVLGVQAMSKGLLSAAGSAGKVKQALTEALRLDGQWYPARSAAVEFYLLAPGVMGGSTSRATELARGAPRPEQAKALLARVALGQEQLDTALASLAELGSPADPALAEDVMSWQVQAGLQLARNEQLAKARPVFERLAHSFPSEAGPAFGLGYALQESGALAEAVKAYEQGLRAKGARHYPGLSYRLGLALQALGRPDEARAALQRFVSAGRGSSKALDDARKRLAQLGGQAG